MLNRCLLNDHVFERGFCRKKGLYVAGGSTWVPWTCSISITGDLAEVHLRGPSPASWVGGELRQPFRVLMPLKREDHCVVWDLQPGCVLESRMEPQV